MLSEIAIPYRLSRHPGNISPEVFLQPAELSQGANCQLFVAGIIRALGKDMPEYYRSSEIFLDPENVLTPIDVKQDIPESGDIIGFWPSSGPQNPKRIHVGIIQITPHGVEVLHAARNNGTVAREPLITLLQHYADIACIKRAAANNVYPYNAEALHRLGFLE